MPENKDNEKIRMVSKSGKPYYTTPRKLREENQAAGGVIIVMVIACLVAAFLMPEYACAWIAGAAGWGFMYLQMR